MKTINSHTSCFFPQPCVTGPAHTIAEIDPMTTCPTHTRAIWQARAELPDYYTAEDIAAGLAEAATEAIEWVRDPSAPGCRG